MRSETPAKWREGPPGAGSARHPGARWPSCLNPGAWLFLATTGSAVVAAATHDGGKPLAFLTVAALMAGVAVIDGTVVVIGGGGAARLTGTAARAVRLALAAVLAGIGAWFLYQGVRP